MTYIFHVYTMFKFNIAQCLLQTLSSSFYPYAIFARSLKMILKAYFKPLVKKHLS